MAAPRGVPATTTWLPREGSPAPTIAFDDFLKLDVRVGTAIEAEPYPEALKPAIELRIDFGPEIWVKRSSAQITKHHAPDRLVGRQVIAVVNVPPRQIGWFISEAPALGVPDADGEVAPLSPTVQASDGGRLF